MASNGDGEGPEEQAGTRAGGPARRAGTQVSVDTTARLLCILHLHCRSDASQAREHPWILQPLAASLSLTYQTPHRHGLGQSPPTAEKQLRTEHPGLRPEAFLESPAYFLGHITQASLSLFKKENRNSHSPHLPRCR